MKNQSILKGSIELYKHAFSHLELATDFDLRISFISLDLCIENVIKTYITINRRRLGITRKKIKGIFRYFPKLLDVLEEKLPNDSISKGQLDLIEFFHSIRNKIYHSGIGITVEKKFIEMYGALIQNLMIELFELENLDDLSDGENIVTKIGKFLMLWARLEQYTRKIVGFQKNERNIGSLNYFIDILRIERNLPDNIVLKFKHLRHYRNRLVHGDIEPQFEEIVEMNRELENLLSEFEEFDVKLEKN